MLEGVHFVSEDVLFEDSQRFAKTLVAGIQIVEQVSALQSQIDVLVFRDLQDLFQRFE